MKIYKIACISVIGCIIGVLFELLWMWQRDIFLTHERSAVISRIITALLEGGLLFLILALLERLRFYRSLKGHLVQLCFLVIYFYIRTITVTLSLFASTLPSAFFGLLIFKLTGQELSMEIVGMIFTVLIDIGFLLLIFFPLLTFGNKWAEKGMRQNDGSDKSSSIPSDQAQ